MAQATYDPTKVILSIAGITVQGFADGTFIKVARDEDAYTKKTGADGQTVRAKNANRGGSAEITLLQSSLSNNELAALAALDELSDQGVGAFLIKDLSGTMRASAENCWVKKPADAERGKEVSDTTWTIDVASPMVLSPGGIP